MATDYIAAVAKIRGYVKVYLDILDSGKSLTEHQAESLKIDLTTLDKNLASLEGTITAASRVVAAPTTDIAHVSDEDVIEIARIYSTQLVNGGGSVEAGDWPELLGPELFARAINGGYFGAPGTVPDMDYSPGVKGVQVQGVTGPDGTLTYTLYKDGEAIASEPGDGTFDTIAFAKRYGYSI